MKWNRIILLIALISSLVTYQIWKVTWEDLFMQGLTFKDVLVMICICRMASQLKDYWIFKIGLVFLSFNFIDMLDEWFGTPLNCGVNEYLAASICGIIVFKEELLLDIFFKILLNRLIIFGNRFVLASSLVIRQIKPILSATIKPVINVFKRRDGRS